MEKLDYFEELQNTYIGIDLDEDNSEELARTLGYFFKFSDANLHKPKEFHLTIDYLGDISRDTLEEIMCIIESSILYHISRIKKQIEYILGAPKHFKSSKTGEDIFYLPVNVNDILLGSLKYIGHSINEPHLTLFKGKNLQEEEIEKILRALNFFLIGKKYKLYINNLCANGTRSNGEQYKNYSGLLQC